MTGLRIRPARLDIFLELRDLRHEVMETIDPGRPQRTWAEDRIFWTEKIETQENYIWEIVFEEKTIGLLYAFNFTESSCETGISIFYPDLRGKGIGTSAYELFDKELKNLHRTSNIIWTRKTNLASQALYKKLGYSKTDATLESLKDWVQYRIEL